MKLSEQKQREIERRAMLCVLRLLSQSGQISRERERAAHAAIMQGLTEGSGHDIIYSDENITKIKENIVQYG